MVVLSGKPGSCWVASTPATDYPRLDQSIRVETVIVGAGVVGLATALRLCEAGRPVVVLEGLRVGRQVTGRSTAKITTQHSLIYRHLIDAFGPDRAQLYADANRAGADQIKDWIRAHAIPCDLQAKAAYAYTTDPARSGEIAAEAEAARSVGLNAEVVHSAPLPFETAAALRFPDQAQFNPARYLVGLADAVTKQGGRIFERSRAYTLEEGSRWHVETDGGSVEAEHLVVATNMTVKSPVGMANRTQPRSHAVMAFRVKDPEVIDGMFISIDDPTRSLRTGRDADGPLLVVLGPKFNTGQEADVASRFQELEDWARENLPVGEVAWRWCNEDYDTPDRVPYVGEPDPEKSSGFHIATGFNAWGISNGTAAGILIADLIQNGNSPWRELYRPDRPYPKDFHRDSESRSIVGSVDEIGRNQGGILVKGKETAAVWRDQQGRIHAVSGSCTHKGCTVSWNNADKTWDCPCHGSIYAADGSVIHGPTRKPLGPVDRKFADLIKEEEIVQ